MKETFYELPGPGLTLALAADFHNTDPGPVLASLGRRKPDMIAVAGDFSAGVGPGSGGVRVREQKNVLPLIRGCAEIAPTYISLGNHEWMITAEDVALLEDAGAAVLDNRFAPFPVPGGGTAWIGGLTSAIVTEAQASRMEIRPRRAYAKALTADGGWLPALEGREGYRILLCHHPEYWALQEPYLARRPIDLVLCGHAHGGQFRLFGRGLFAPGQGWFPRYTGGVHDGEHGRMVISRGLSNPASPIPRLFNPTELVYIKLGDK